MFGIGDTELLFILIFAFILFGPDKLPELGKTIGKGIKRFQNAQDSINQVVQEQVIDPVQKAAQGSAEDSNVPTKNISKSNGINNKSQPASTSETFAQKSERLQDIADKTEGDIPLDDLYAIKNPHSKIKAPEKTHDPKEKECL